MGFVEAVVAQLLGGGLACFLVAFAFANAYTILTCIFPSSLSSSGQRIVALILFAGLAFVGLDMLIVGYGYLTVRAGLVGSADMPMMLVGARLTTPYILARWLSTGAIVLAISTILAPTRWSKVIGLSCTVACGWVLLAGAYLLRLSWLCIQATPEVLHFPSGYQYLVVWLFGLGTLGYLVYTGWLLTRRNLSANPARGNS